MIGNERQHLVREAGQRRRIAPQIMDLAGQPVSMQQAAVMRQTAPQRKRIVGFKQSLIKATEKRQDHALHAVAAHTQDRAPHTQARDAHAVPSIDWEAGFEAPQRSLQVALSEGRRPCRVMSLKHQFVARPDAARVASS